MSLAVCATLPAPAGAPPAFSATMPPRHCSGLHCPDLQERARSNLATSICFVCHAGALSRVVFRPARPKHCPSRTGLFLVHVCRGSVAAGGAQLRLRLPRCSHLPSWPHAGAGSVPPARAAAGTRACDSLVPSPSHCVEFTHTLNMSNSKHRRAACRSTHTQRPTSEPPVKPRERLFERSASQPYALAALQHPWRCGHDHLPPGRCFFGNPC